MRESDGTYVGHHICAHYGGVSEYFERTCCGGKSVVKVARCVCLISGVVEAELNCNARCDSFTNKPKPGSIVGEEAL